MSAAFISDIQDALNLIREHGRSITYKRVVRTPTPGKPYEIVKTYTNYNIKAIFQGTKQSTNPEANTRRSDDLVLIDYADLGFIPLKEDLIQDADFEYSVTDVVPFQPGDIPIIIQLEVKR